MNSMPNKADEPRSMYTADAMKRKIEGAVFVEMTVERVKVARRAESENPRSRCQEGDARAS